MIQKKICMLGSNAVGKTSVIARYVRSMFFEQYSMTVGVAVHKKSLAIDGLEMDLLLWDLHGQDEFERIRPAYLRGTSGYLLVADGTRPATLDAAVALQGQTESITGTVPFVLVLNKSDLAGEWRIDDRAISRLAERGWTIVRTSAKSGAGVEEVFETLARAMNAA